MNYLNSTLLFLGLIVIGVTVELVMWKFHKRHKFSFWSYLYLLFFPFVATITIINIHGFSLIKAFIIFAVIGSLFEWAFGYAYHRIVGQRLWTYHRFGFGGYTSTLSFPVWGMAGILFWLIGQVV